MTFDQHRLETVPEGLDPVEWVRYGKARQETVKMPLMPVGTHNVRAVEASVYESDGGALMLALRLESENGEHATTHQCLIRKDGAPNERTLESLRAIFAWDGNDPYTIVDAVNAGTSPQFEAVIEADEYQGKPSIKVAWINPLGSGAKALKAGDRNALLAKFGAKLRACAVPATAKPPAAKPPVPPPAEDNRASRYAPATMEQAWAELCRLTPRDAQPDRTKAWQEYIAKTFPGKNQSTLTPEDWGNVLAHAGEIARGIIAF